ncbi:unnamed protein product [Heligmosomoides polygyrus]|uniref:Uncharacterized protein n=1 Tax=Heligmosomoides polygyrus TaxID=6339 RepID=A0A3P7WP22_HELPZ|nr:unnamed protein product [Heligmosomoides polygyrus]
MASIESQTTRLCKQFEKIDNAQKDERRRSLSKDCSATIIAELANLLNELKTVHLIMDNIKVSFGFSPIIVVHLYGTSLAVQGSNPSFVRRSPPREQVASQPPKCGKCAELQKAMDEQQNEVIFYKKKNKDLTNQVRLFT